MANERKTEQIVRIHFEQYLEKLVIEEQQSENMKVDKLLKSASKKGLGKGYPDLIISYRNQPNFLIVIECKSDLAKHESASHHQYSDYAVDGVLLYASYLSREFDVLAIAVSGETKQHLKVSHFLHLKDEKKAISIFGNQLLAADDYLSGYFKSPEKFRQDYDALLEFTKELNIKLHVYKIRESDRALLISAILIALENDAFRKSYSSHATSQSLANILLQTVSHELEEAGMTHKNLENLEIQFSFIQTDTSLSKKGKVLKELIDEIDKNINQFIKTHEYFDVLGQLYIEFLRYANSDKGLGIVLTPPHITELFVDLAQVNKNSIIYDNCTGTGGFLISAMKKMILDAKGNEEKIKKIKTTQLLGTEYQAHIFALSVSNMYIHQDGKTNITNGSCFETEIIDHIQPQKPTVGFLNPPYQSNKKTDTDELMFVLNNLECLVEGGICIAIVPMKSALAQKGKTFELKKKLLEHHTLEAVLSMPEELFHNSKVSPVSVIIILTAHKPHPKGKKTWLGYFRNDNFIKTKDKGRIDLDGTWEKIKKEWITLYRNREIKKDISLTRELLPVDEWCIESYLIFDYQKITAYQFKEKLQKYLAFRLLHNLLNFQIEHLERTHTYEELVPLFKIFDVKNGLASSNVEVLNVPENHLDIRYIRPSQTYEGSIAGYVNKTFIEEKFIYPDNTLYVSTDGQGSHTYSYVSSFEFIPNSNVSVLIPRRTMSLQEKIYYALCISSNRYKFSYGRKPKGNRLKNILLPLSPPDYVYRNVFNEIFDNWKKIIK